MAVFNLWRSNNATQWYFYPNVGQENLFQSVRHASLRGLSDYIIMYNKSPCSVILDVTLNFQEYRIVCAIRLTMSMFENLATVEFVK